MVCALTVRRLRPGTFDEFREAFMQELDPAEPPARWVRFDMVRSTSDPDEVICFGFFDGTVDELRRSADEQGYADQQAAIAPFVTAVGTDGLFEVVEEFSQPGAATA